MTFKLLYKVDLLEEVSDDFILGDHTIYYWKKKKSASFEFIYFPIYVCFLNFVLGLLS